MGDVTPITSFPDHQYPDCQQSQVHSHQIQRQTEGAKLKKIVQSRIFAFSSIDCRDELENATL